MGYSLIIIGMICIVMGFITLNKSVDNTKPQTAQHIERTKPKPAETKPEPAAAKEEIATVTQEKAIEEEPAVAPTALQQISVAEPVKPAAKPQKESVADTTDAETKGLEFEKYVVSNFSKKYFTLNEWRGDKYIDGRYAESNTYPDLEYTLHLKSGDYKFAIECKWRSKTNTQGEVQWCNKAQLKRYNNFADNKDMPVFIVLGIGGKPSNPDEVYCIPLKELHSNTVRHESIEQYRHDTSKQFYYDAKKQELS